MKVSEFERMKMDMCLFIGVDLSVNYVRMMLVLWNMGNYLEILLLWLGLRF